MRELCRECEAAVNTPNLLERMDLRVPIRAWESAASYKSVSERKKLTAAGCIALPAGASSGRSDSGGCQLVMQDPRHAMMQPLGVA
jgi:hypothetical protein